MADRPFVHLHCHTHYSLLDGASRVPELVQRVKSLGMNACAITDHGNLYGAIEFYKECKAGGINPVVGYEAYVAPGRRDERAGQSKGDAANHLTLLAHDANGFKNLIKMASVAFMEGFYYVPRIDRELLEAHSQGITCLSGCASSEFSDYILKDKMKEAAETAAWLAKVFGKHFYVEIQNNGLEIQRQCAAGAIEIANKMGLPLVATCDAHYLTREDAPAHDVLLCINTKRLRSDSKRMRYGNGDGNMIDQFYVRPPSEMYALFPEHHDAVRRSQEIADGCDLVLDFKKRHFPVYVPPEGKTPDDYLHELCEEGLRYRYGGKASEAVRKRLGHELGIICKMGFSSYFLIVSDFVRFAVEEGIPCTARGSACGALVSYLLKLSHVDPLEYDLLFERFLDPSRSEAPDIDIDFCQDRREEVIDYVRRTYGVASVAQIATFGTMAAKAAIKDVGRVLNVPLQRVLQLTEMIPSKPLGITIDQALGMNNDLRALYEGDAEVNELIDIAKSLEGTNRQTGIHAAGVVIANGPLTDYVPVHRAKGKEDESGVREAVIATQWVMGDLEKVGMLKMDFLGLRTLTLLENAVKLIEKSQGVRIDLQNLPLDDHETYALLQRGDAKGVFQLESDGIRELLKRMKPDNIRDLIAVLALYRPGPLEGGMVDDYVNIKHGRQQPSYSHPVMEEVLAETYGVLVYQEQIMRILNRLGGIELGSAYACIKAISKKKQDIIDARKIDFINGSKERGVAEKTAEEIFDLIVVFAGYGFNKSHTAAYAKVGYQTAYLKAHFTAEFMAALLTSEIDDGNKRDVMVDHIADAKKLGVAVLAPDVNRSRTEFSVAGNMIVFGLAAIKGCGRTATDAVVAARESGGKFADLFDFCERVDHKAVPKAAIEKLIMAGALDCFAGHRAQQMAVLPRALKAASERQNDKKAGQGGLFEALPAANGQAAGGPEALPEVTPWSNTEQLKNEKAVLDFYFSSHPLAQREKEIARYASHTVAGLVGVPGETEVRIGGLLTQVRIMTYKKPQRNGNTRYGRCKVEDLTGTLECVMWGDEFIKYKELFVDDQEPILVVGKLERKTDEPALQITRLLRVEDAVKEQATGLHLLFTLGQHSIVDVTTLANVLRKTPGSCPVVLTIKDAAGRRCTLRMGREFNINPAQYLKDELVELLGPKGVMLR